MSFNVLVSCCGLNWSQSLSIALSTSCCLDPSSNALTRVLSSSIVNFLSSFTRHVVTLQILHYKYCTTALAHVTNPTLVLIIAPQPPLLLLSLVNLTVNFHIDLMALENDGKQTEDGEALHKMIICISKSIATLTLVYLLKSAHIILGA